jgi:ABC-type transport system substrate-binding protein
VSPVNYTWYIDRTLDAQYEKQSRTADHEERRRAIRDFEKRLLDEETHYIYTFQGGPEVVASVIYADEIRANSVVAAHIYVRNIRRR